jgi:hypothetical protein
MLALALSVGGCAVSGSMGSMFSRSSKDEAKAYVEAAGGDRPVATLPRVSCGLDHGPAAETDLRLPARPLPTCSPRGSKEISALGKSVERRTRHRT